MLQMAESTIPGSAAAQASSLNQLSDHGGGAENQADIHDDLMPDDSASQAGMYTLSELSKASKSSLLAHIKVKAAAKKAALVAKTNALRELQNVELQELKCRQRRDEIELQMQMAEAEAEELVCNEFVGSVRSKTPTEINSSTIQIKQQAVTSSTLNPAAPEWNGILGNVGQQQQLLETLQLPKIEVMTFDGNPVQYWPFIRSFENTVEKVSVGSQARLTRLMQHCVGKARQVIQCCCIMDPEVSYKKAKQLLKERFGNDYVIMESWIKRVTSVIKIGRAHV